MPWTKAVYTRTKLLAYRERLEEDASQVKAPLSFTASGHKDIHSEGAPTTMEDPRTESNQYSVVSSSASAGKKGAQGTGLSGTAKLGIVVAVLIGAWLVVKS